MKTRTFTFTLKPWQQIYFATCAITWAVSWGGQTWGGLQLIKENDKLRKIGDELSDQANRSVYLVMYLVTRCAELGVEFEPFDVQVLQNPPKMFDPELPNLFTEFFDKFTGGEDPSEEELIAFMNLLKKAREADE